MQTLLRLCGHPGDLLTRIILVLYLGLRKGKKQTPSYGAALVNVPTDSVHLMEQHWVSDSIRWVRGHWDTQNRTACSKHG